MREVEVNHTIIGFTDSALENKWVWTDGSLTSYVHWKAKQPDNNRNEDCGVLTLPGWEGYWNDVSCSHKYNYICKKKCKKQELFHLQLNHESANIMCLSKNLINTFLF